MAVGPIKTVDFPAATTVGPADQFVVLQGGKTKRALVSLLPGGGGGVTDHGALTGLLDDDHPQYLTAGRADSWFATKDHGALTGLGDDDHTQYYNAARLTVWWAALQPLDHGALGGLGDDDHTQYHTDARAESYLTGRSTAGSVSGTDKAVIVQGGTTKLATLSDIVALGGGGGGAAAATQAEMEAASSTTTYASPGRTQHHPGVAKAWISFDGTGLGTILASHNILAFTKHGTGDYTVTFDTPFSAAAYSFAGTTTHQPGVYAATVFVDASHAPTTSTFRLSVIDSAALRDAPFTSISFFGDQ